MQLGSYPRTEKSTLFIAPHPTYSSIISHVPQFINTYSSTCCFFKESTELVWNRHVEEKISYSIKAHSPPKPQRSLHLSYGSITLFSDQLLNEKEDTEHQIFSVHYKIKGHKGSTLLPHYQMNLSASSPFLDEEDISRFLTKNPPAALFLSRAPSGNLSFHGCLINTPSSEPISALPIFTLLSNLMNPEKASLAPGTGIAPGK